MFSGMDFDECPADPLLPAFMLIYALLTCLPVNLFYFINFFLENPRKKHRAIGLAMASVYTALLTALLIAGEFKDTVIVQVRCACACVSAWRYEHVC
jgi:hypothetical protein